MSGGEDLRVRLPAGSKRPSLPRKETPGHAYTISPRVPDARHLQAPEVLGREGGVEVPFVIMDIAQLIDLSLTGIDERSVHVMPLEPAEVSAEAVAGLAGVLIEMSSILVATGSVDGIRAAGAWRGDTYVISLSAGAGGISGDGLRVLNRLLDDPGLAMGVASVARAAARHDLVIRLTPEGSGTAVEVTVPANSLKRMAPSQQLAPTEAPSSEFIPHELERRVLVPADSAWDESEAFLESVFGALRNPWREPDRPEPAVLQVRVPGESFSLTDDNSPSTSAAEAAVDLRSALTTFDQGRRAAEIATDSVEATA
jgi:hypothetical protein